MKNQKKLPEAWYLEKGDEIKINGKKFRVTKIDGVPEDDPYLGPKPEKWFYLTDNYRLDVTEKGMNFGKVIPQDKYNYDIKSLKIKSFKILKSKYFDS